MTAGIIIGILSGWLSMLFGAVIIGRVMVKHPPEAALKFLTKTMARQMVKGVVKSGNGR